MAVMSLPNNQVVNWPSVAQAVLQKNLFFSWCHPLPHKIVEAPQRISTFWIQNYLKFHDWFVVYGNVKWVSDKIMDYQSVWVLVYIFLQQG